MNTFIKERKFKVTRQMLSKNIEVKLSKAHCFKYVCVCVCVCVCVYFWTQHTCMLEFFFFFIDWFADIEESLHPWDKAHLVMVYDLLCVVGFWLLEFCLGFLHLCSSVILACIMLFLKIILPFLIDRITHQHPNLLSLPYCSAWTHDLFFSIQNGKTQSVPY